MDPSSTDLEQLRSRCQGDTARMKRYIGMFLATTPGLFDQLRLDLGAGDLEGLARNAHGLKPQAEYMGAARLKARLEELEGLARSGDHQGSTSALEECLRTHYEVTRELEAALAGL